MTPFWDCVIVVVMFDRTLRKVIGEEAGQYPVIAITGPRQSGKTTLVRELFPDHRYILLEDPDIRDQALLDARGFFRRFSGSLILDEVQKVPDLLSYLQGIVDDPDNRREFVLTGSEHLLLSDTISQTLAGRARIYHLLPLSQSERASSNAQDAIFAGGYPRIHDRNLKPTTWLAQYYATYIQRDVRAVLNVSNLDQFDRFVRLAAGRTGQLLDYASIGSDCGVSQPTAKAWYSVLKASFICFTLEPHFRNFGKRIIKSPKSYFFDTGLLCYLLRIKDTSQLENHPLYGSVFENYIIAERLKRLLHNGDESNLYFWRDQKGHEVDLVADNGDYLFPTEIKSSETFHKSFCKNLKYLNSIQDRANDGSGECIYGGEETFDLNHWTIRSWRDI